MRVPIALWLALLLCPALSAQEVPLARPAARPCPALLRRVDHWITQLGEAIKPRLRNQLHARLRASGKAGVMRMAAALMPAAAAAGGILSVKAAAVVAPVVRAPRSGPAARSPPA